MKRVMLGLCLVSCGSYSHYVDPELAPTLDAVYAECPALSRATHEIRFSAATMPGVNAYCQGTQYLDGLKRVIVVDRQDWATFTGVQQKLLLLHELIHCELDVVGHSEDRMDIMYSRSVEAYLAEEIYASRWKYCNK